MKAAVKQILDGKVIDEEYESSSAWDGIHSLEIEFRVSELKSPWK
jgi:hypothetical protein